MNWIRLKLLLFSSYLRPVKSFLIRKYFVRDMDSSFSCHITLGLFYCYLGWRPLPSMEWLASQWVCFLGNVKCYLNSIYLENLDWVKMAYLKLCLLYVSFWFGNSSLTCIISLIGESSLIFIFKLNYASNIY